MSSSARASTSFVDRTGDIAAGWPLFSILAIGLVVRLAFIGGAGFHNDISAFEAWALTLTEHPLAQFYRSTSFADYPPGYFFILLPIGWIFKGLVASHLIAHDAYGVLAKLVKLPAIVMDIVDAGLLFLIVRRFASNGKALLAAALMALNPAAIYISAYWGQIDSVSWGLVLLGIYLLLRANGDVRGGTRDVALAWIVLAMSILIKPQGTFVGFVFLAYAFVAGDAAERARRLLGTAIGIAGGIVIAWLASGIFHGTFNPIADFTWLFGQYAFASSVYPYTTINAFNLYALKNSFWQPDSDPLRVFGFAVGPTVVWGALLVVGASVLIVARYLQRKDERAFLEASMLVSFAFFTLATRMHERYSFGAFLLMMPLVAFGRRYTLSTVILSITLLANLSYSLYYQTVMEQKIPGVDPTNLWPWVSHPLSLVNVLLFFVLGYLYLGGATSAIEGVVSDLAPARAGLRAAWLRTRSWFDPVEGLTTLERRDWMIAIGLTLASFVLCILWYQWPAEKYFDEIYYPRAGEEYLSHKEIFEYTHPPLTKLIITLSMMLFGGLHGLGDTGFGWRFLNVVIGALTVGVIYIFAKHLTRSTLFATIAGGMLLFDGFHYVQSRIATPEITVAFFALTTLYAFYRFWIASGVRRDPAPGPGYRRAFAITLAVGGVLSLVLAYVATTLGTPTSGLDYRPITFVISFAYFGSIVWVFARSLLPRWMPGVGATVSYGDGTQLRVAGTEFKGATLDGLALSSAAAKGKKDEIARVNDDEATRSYSRDGSMRYTTPAAEATYTPDGVLTVAGIRLDGNDARLWMILLAISGGAAAASKWNGLFDIIIVWGLAALVVAQRWLRRPALYGNPFGISLDVMVAGMFAVGGGIYTACYIPYFTLGHNLIDMVSLQHAMYQYHSTLVATHPYASKWWQWPIIQKPISYWYKDYRIGAATQNPAACCVSEILALPNPFIWWAGLISVPIVGVLAWIERKRGYALLITAYFLQWLPWILSPRIAFEYHFYPNLAIIVLCNAIVLQRIWNWRTEEGAFSLPRISIGIYLVICVITFFFFFPILAGVHVTWDAWHARMWFPNWII